MKDLRFAKLEASLNIRLSSKEMNFSSLIYLEKERGMRIDILGPFHLLLVSVISYKKSLSLIDWKEKKVYENKKAKEKMKSFLGLYIPPFFIESILWQNVQAFKSWKCKKEKEKLKSCKKKSLKVVWKFQSSTLKGVSIQSLKPDVNVDIDIEKIKTKVFKKAFLRPSYFQSIF